MKNEMSIGAICLAVMFCTLILTLAKCDKQNRDRKHEITMKECTK